MNRKPIGRWGPALSVVLLLLVPHAGSPGVGAGAALAAAVTDDGDWPATRAGALARGWVAAFVAGEAEMKAFLARELAPKSLETTKLPKRLERYRELRAKYGRLEFASVVESSPEKLTLKLMDESGDLHEFVFTVQAAAPFKLVSVGIKQRGHGSGGHGFGH